MPQDAATESHSHVDVAAGPRRRIELLPNCSLTPRDARRFFALCAGTSLTIAAFFVANGYWPVLPFAGLELALLAFALWASLKRRHYVQTVEIDETDITITTRDPRGERVTQFSRHWARVTLRDPRGWQPGRLLIESHGRACEIGAFLTEEARRALGRRLTALVGRTCDLPALAPADSDGTRDRGEQ
jgi:uncharacterized membrane protein